MILCHTAWGNGAIRDVSILAHNLRSAFAQVFCLRKLAGPFNGSCMGRTYREALLPPKTIVVLMLLAALVGLTVAGVVLWYA